MSDRTRYLVVLHDDDGVLTLGTRTAWVDRADAEHYARTCHPSRAAMVVTCYRGIDIVTMPAQADAETREAILNDRLLPRGCHK